MGETTILIGTRSLGKETTRFHIRRRHRVDLRKFAFLTGSVRVPRTVVRGISSGFVHVQSVLEFDDLPKLFERWRIKPLKCSGQLEFIPLSDHIVPERPVRNPTNNMFRLF